MKRTTALVLAMLALSGAAGPAYAEAPARRVIVVVHDAAVEQNRRPPQADARADRDPVGWGRLDARMLAVVQGLEARYGFVARRAYSDALRGFAAELTPAQEALLRSEPLVDYVEEDFVATTSQTAQQTPWGIAKIGATVSSTVAGNGIGDVTGPTAYVIDTGVAAHPDINRTAFLNFTADGIDDDCNGHGTHVAGTIAARDDSAYVVGVAPGTPVQALKVLGCGGSGSYSDIIAAVNWLAANHLSRAVANMSLGGPKSKALDSAITAAVGKGVFFAVAAGNSATNACNASPANLGSKTSGLMSTGALDANDRPASFSNYGSCVDQWGPGVGVLSTYPGGLATASGTSMASPHVAGAAVLWWSAPANAAARPADVENAIRANDVSLGTYQRAPVNRVDVRNF